MRGWVSVRKAATTALGKLAKYVPIEQLSALTEPLLRRLGDDDRMVRKAATTALGELAKCLPTEQLSALTEPLLRRLGDDDRMVRKAATLTLATISTRLSPDEITTWTKKIEEQTSEHSPENTLLGIPRKMLALFEEDEEPEPSQEEGPPRLS